MRMSLLYICDETTTQLIFANYYIIICEAMGVDPLILSMPRHNTLLHKYIYINMKCLILSGDVENNVGTDRAAGRRLGPVLDWK